MDYPVRFNSQKHWQNIGKKREASDILFFKSVVLFCQWSTATVIESRVMLSTYIIYGLKTIQKVEETRDLYSLSATRALFLKIMAAVAGRSDFLLKKKRSGLVAASVRFLFEMIFNILFFKIIKTIYSWKTLLYAYYDN